MAVTKAPDAPKPTTLEELAEHPAFKILERVQALGQRLGVASMETATLAGLQPRLEELQRVARYHLPGGEGAPKDIDKVYKRDEPKMRAFLHALEQGAYVKDALAAAGVTRTTLKRWLERAELGFVPYEWFPKAYNDARDAARDSRGVPALGEAVIAVDLRTGEVIRPVYRKGTIYFIREEEDGPIKIGFTEKSVASRLKTLQTGNPRVLRLLASVPGDQGVEETLHAHFSELNLVGEWFTPEAPLLALIDELRALARDAAADDVFDRVRVHVEERLTSADT